MDAGLTQTFGYDGLSRLTAAAIPGGNATTLGYDAVGNRNARTDSAPTSATTYTSAGTSNRLQQTVQGALTRTYTTNAVGDATAFTGPDGVANTLGYDPFGRLASHTRAGTITTYTVNALDQRMAKSNAGSNSLYVYAGQNLLLAEYTNGQWTSYLWNGNAPVAMVRDNQIYYIHTDHLGRPQLATDANRTVVWKASNYGFNRGVSLDAMGGLNIGFPGQYLDAESGIWHNGYRDYDYTTGRYLQSDPIGLGGGINTYAYVRGNPISLVDPFGLVDLNLVAPWDPAHAGMNAIPHQPGIFSVGVHFDGINFYGSNGQPMTPQQVADAINDSGAYNGKDTVRMYACRVGASIDGKAPAAQSIANGLPGGVQASNSWIFVGSTQGYLGTYSKTPSGGMDTSNPGQWLFFQPRP